LPRFNTLNYSNQYLTAAGAFPINPGAQPFVVSSFLFVNYTNRVLFLSRTQTNPTASQAEVTIGAYFAMPVYDWGSVNLYVGSNGAALQSSDYINVQLCDERLTWPTAPVQPPFVLPAGAATEATLQAFQAANHADLTAYLMSGANTAGGLLDTIKGLLSNVSGVSVSNLVTGVSNRLTPLVSTGFGFHLSTGATIGGGPFAQTGVYTVPANRFAICSVMISALCYVAIPGATFQELYWTSSGAGGILSVALNGAAVGDHADLQSAPFVLMAGQTLQAYTNYAAPFGGNFRIAMSANINEYSIT